MPRRTFGRSRRRLKKVFKRNPRLRRRLGARERKHVFQTLDRYRSGGGITKRELSRATRRLKKRGDPINKDEARFIKEELGGYLEKLEDNSSTPYASRRFFQRGYDSSRSSTAADRADVLNRLRREPSTNTADRFSDDRMVDHSVPDLPPPPDEEPPDIDPNVVYPDFNEDE